MASSEQRVRENDIIRCCSTRSSESSITILIATVALPRFHTPICESSYFADTRDTTDNLNSCIHLHLTLPYPQFCQFNAIQFLRRFFCRASGLALILIELCLKVQ